MTIFFILFKAGKNGEGDWRTGRGGRDGTGDGERGFDTKPRLGGTKIGLIPSHNIYGMGWDFGGRDGTQWDGGFFLKYLYICIEITRL